MMEFRQQIEALVTKGKTNEALNLLKKQEKLPKLYLNDIIILQGRLEKLKKDQQQGTTTYQEISIEHNKLTRDTINLVSDIVKYQQTPKRSLKNLFLKSALRTPKTNDFAKEADNIRQKLLERYEHRLQQKTDNRLPIELELAYTKEGTSPEYPHLDEYRVSEKLQGDLIDTLKKHRHLLIVGKPGVGKTTQLLELAKAWLSDSTNEQIPIIFNLSAWKADDQYLHDWLQAVLVSSYGFSSSLAREAMDKQKIIPLLDGLDEVGKDKIDEPEQIRLRNQCLKAISRYLSLYNMLYLVICSRIKEFVDVGDAPVKAEILVNLLTPEVVKHTLKVALAEPQHVNNETAATTILNLLQKYPILEDVLCTPFYYNIALDVFDDRTMRHDLPQEKDALELYLIEQFITKKLNSTPNPNNFTEEKTKHSLAWVAHFLNQESWVNFELVNFQRQHLRRKWLMNLVFGLVFGLILGLTIGLVESFVEGLIVDLVEGWIFGLLFGLIVGLVFILVFGLFVDFKVKPVKIRKIKWSNLLKLSTWTYSIYLALVFGLVFSLVFGLVGGLVLGLITNLIFDLSESWIGNLVLGLILGLTSGLITGLVNGLVKKVFVVTTFSIAESPYHRLRSDVFFKIIHFNFINILIFFTFNCLGKGFHISLFIAVALAIFLFISFFKHFIIRFALYLEKKMPLRWVSFFKYTTSARILEQDGGQWRFRHQLLQDYFAERWIE